MRVTNEQVQKIRTTSYNFRDQVTGVTTVDIATDLLDARELIDKQESIIKEMREELVAVVSTASTSTTKGELVYINNYIEMRAILEKTKDYA